MDRNALLDDLADIEQRLAIDTSRLADQKVLIAELDREATTRTRRSCSSPNWNRPKSCTSSFVNASLERAFAATLTFDSLDDERSVISGIAQIAVTTTFFTVEAARAYVGLIFVRIAPVNPAHSLDLDRGRCRLLTTPLDEASLLPSTQGN
jgi:hypothetical protein